MVGGSDREWSRSSAALYIVPAAFLLLAILPWPYGYYQLLRLVVCSCAAIIAWGYHRHGNGVGLKGISLLCMALLFNPVFPIHLEREIWIIFNLLGATLFSVLFVTDRRGIGRLL